MLTILLTLIYGYLNYRVGRWYEREGRLLGGTKLTNIPDEWTH